MAAVRPAGAGRGAVGAATALDPPWVTTYHVTIPCYEDEPGGGDVIHAPPGKVVEVCVVAERVFLTLCDYNETHKSTTVKTISQINIDAAALLNALIAQMGLERVRLAVPFPETSGAP